MSSYRCCTSCGRNRKGGKPDVFLLCGDGYHTSQPSLDKERDTIEKFAKTLRLKLKQGDTCPVCRLIITSEIPHEDMLSQLIEGLQLSYYKSKEHYEKLLEEIQRLDAAISSEEQTCQLEKEALSQDKTLERSQANALEACRACGIDKLDDHTLRLLEERIATYSLKENSLTQKINDGAAQEKVAKDLLKQVNQARENKERLKIAALNAENVVNECKNRIESILAHS